MTLESGRWSWTTREKRKRPLELKKAKHRYNPHKGWIGAFFRY